MQIGILALTYRHHGGVFQYHQTLVQSLSLLVERGFEITVVASDEFAASIEALSSTVQTMRISLNPLKKHILDLGRYTGLPLPIQFPKLDLLVSPNISLLPVSLSIPFVVTIHDFQYKYYPSLFPHYKRWARGYQYPKAASHAKHVVCESMHVRDDLVRFTGVAPDKISIIQSPPSRRIVDQPSSIAEKAASSLRVSLPNAFLFYPAALWEHKNHIRLLRAIALIREQYGLSIPLVLVGAKRSSYDSVMRAVQELGLSDLVHFKGYVPDEHIGYLYRQATALVMPTLFESVSLPIWEAFMFGTPVIASNVCALPEQVGNAGVLFDPFDESDIANKVLLVWKDGSLRKQLVQNGFARVKELTIENYANRWQKLFESIGR
jgi:glycosyltransferase involved in cell wall biosynthesis